MEREKKNWIPTPRFLLRKKAFENVVGKDFFENKKCLEIGFGAGEILKLAVQGGAEKVMGYELSEQALEIASERLKDEILSGKIILTDNFEKAEENAPYHVLMAFEVLEHIKDDFATFEKWVSMVERGGYLAISVPSNMKKWGYSDIWAGHYRRYERADLENLCEKCGVEIVKLISYGFPLTEITDRLMNISLKKKAIRLKEKGAVKEELSKNSGIDRKDNALFRLLFSDLFLFPFYFMQKLFYKTDLGTGYILLVRKK